MKKQKSFGQQFKNGRLVFKIQWYNWTVSTYSSTNFTQDLDIPRRNRESSLIVQLEEIVAIFRD